MRKKTFIGLSDSNLMKLWRQAVLKEWDDRCGFCGYHNPEVLQCHHYVKRRVRLLRWDYRNGIALCPRCHGHAHTKTGDVKLHNILMEKGLIDYLHRYEHMTLKEYLRINEMSRNEFLQETKEDLLKRIGQ